MPSSAVRDADLVARALQGDRRAEEQLYRSHAPAVTAIATRLLGRSAEAEDVVQDAFVHALGRLAQLREGAHFRPWLMRIAVHEVHRRYRRRKLLRALGLDRGEDDAALLKLASPALSSESRAELARIDRVLGELGARERVAFMLRHVEGLELAEIASACDASLATVKRWIARAQQRVSLHVREGGEP